MCCGLCVVCIVPVTQVSGGQTQDVGPLTVMDKARGMVWPGIVWYQLVLYGIIWYGPVWSCQVWSGIVLSGPLWYYLVFAQATRQCQTRRDQTSW